MVGHDGRFFGDDALFAQIADHAAGLVEHERDVAQGNTRGFIGDVEVTDDGGDRINAGAGVGLRDEFHLAGTVFEDRLDEVPLVMIDHGVGLEGSQFVVLARADDGSIIGGMPDRLELDGVGVELGQVGARVLGSRGFGLGAL